MLISDWPKRLLFPLHVQRRSVLWHSVRTFVDPQLKTQSLGFVPMSLCETINCMFVSNCVHTFLEQSCMFLSLLGLWWQIAVTLLAKLTDRQTDCADSY